MYILIEKERLPEGRHYETMPDGRCIVSGREARMMGIIEGVTVVMNTAELEKMRRVQTPDQETSDNEQGTAAAQSDTLENNEEEDYHQEDSEEETV